MVMRPLTAGAACVAALLATSAALGADVIVTIENRSSDTISGINSFPIGADGEVIDDNIGGIIDAVPHGGTGRFSPIGDCGPIRLYVRLVSQGDKPDMQFEVDTCRARALVLND
jgi:hypothetical protein